MLGHRRDSHESTVTRNMADWDDEDFEPADFKASAAGVATDKWEGEDEDDDLKDNWDDEDEEGKKNEDDSTIKAVQVKKKKPLKDRIAEKEAKRKEEMQKELEEMEAARRPKTAEEKLAEKLKQQKIQEEADLQLAKEVLGVNDEAAKGDGIDSFNPSSEEDFEKMKTLLRDKITKYEKSPHYIGFIDSLFREISVSMEPEDLKKLGNSFNAVASEKQKVQKAAKAKKKSKKATLVAGKDDNYDDYMAGAEYEDFI